MKANKQENINTDILFQLTLHLLSYRTGMKVTEAKMFYDRISGWTEYYVCPRCKITMEREFMPYCSRCGQKIDRKGYRKAALIYPENHCKEGISFGMIYDTGD